MQTHKPQVQPREGEPPWPQLTHDLDIPGPGQATHSPLSIFSSQMEEQAPGPASSDTGRQ